MDDKWDIKETSTPKKYRLIRYNGDASNSSTGTEEDIKSLYQLYTLIREILVKDGDL